MLFFAFSFAVGLLLVLLFVCLLICGFECLDVCVDLDFVGLVYVFSFCFQVLVFGSGILGFRVLGFCLS